MFKWFWCFTSILHECWLEAMVHSTLDTLVFLPYGLLVITDGRIDADHFLSILLNSNQNLIVIYLSKITKSIPFSHGLFLSEIWIFG